MLPFNLLVMILYGVDTILFEKFDGKPVYSPLNWFGNPGIAIGVFISIMCGMIIIFSILLLFSNYVKLPIYRRKEEITSAERITG